MEISKEPSPIEKVVIAAKAGLSLTKHGGVLAVLLDQLIPSTWQRRMDELLTQLQTDFEQLEGRINKDRLQSDNFHISLIRIMRNAVLEPQREKQKAFRAILLNDALATSSNVEKDLFVKITEDLTHEHIQVLRVLHDPGKIYGDNPRVAKAVQSVTLTNRFEPSPSDIPSILLHPALPDIPNDHWEVLLDGLARYGLISDLRFTGAGWRTVYTVEHILKKRTTPLGNRYIESITLPE